MAIDDQAYKDALKAIEAGDIPGDVALYRHSTHGFFPDDSTNYVIGWTRGTDRYAIIPGTKGQVTNIGPKADELNNKIERLTKIANRSAEDIVNQSGGRVSLEQATTNINKAKKDLNWKPKISFEKGVKILLKNIDYWKNAPVWTKSKITKATKNWFKYLK